MVHSRVDVKISCYPLRPGSDPFQNGLIFSVRLPGHAVKYADVLTSILAQQDLLLILWTALSQAMQ